MLTNAFLWHKSEDINKKGSKISVDFNFYVYKLCMIKSRQRDFMQKRPSFRKEMISA